MKRTFEEQTTLKKDQPVKKTVTISVDGKKIAEYKVEKKLLVNTVKWREDGNKILIKLVKELDNKEDKV